MNAKKIYEVPRMSILDMKIRTRLLSCSNCGPEADGYDDEFGLKNFPEKDRQA